MYSVLIVDDERIIREGLKKFVNWKDLKLCPLEPARNTSQALEICMQTPPDILITDIRMPGADGFELIHALLEAGQRPQVILISSYDEFVYAQKAVQFDIIRDYILKPIDMSKLTSILKNICEYLRQRESVVEMAAMNVSEYRDFLRFLRQNNFDRQVLMLNLQNGDRERSMNYLDEMFRLAEDFAASVNILIRFCLSVVMNLISAGFYDREEDPIRTLYTNKTYSEVQSYMRRLISDCLDISARGSAGRSKLIETAISIIRSNYREYDFNLDALANMLNITPGYLSAKFKEETGQGFTKYLIEKQMEQAKLLLGDPRNKIYHVAHGVGYQDEKYFCRVFKKYTGYSPRAYREKYISKYE